jgi:hypothetical protein
MPTMSAFRIPSLQRVDEIGDVVITPGETADASKLRPVVSVGPNASDGLLLVLGTFDLPLLTGRCEGIFADQNDHAVGAGCALEHDLSSPCRTVLLRTYRQIRRERVDEKFVPLKGSSGLCLR